MRKACRIFFGILLVSILGGLAWTVLRKPQVPNPIYKGKSLSQWLEQVDVSKGQSALTTNAAEAVLHMGTNCIPYLLWEAGTQDSELKLSVMRFLNRFLPDRYSVFGSGQRHLSAMRGLFVLGGAAIPPAMDGLTNADKQIRLGSEVALLALRARSPIVTQGLIANLHDKNVAVRAQAAQTLGFLGRDESENVLPALMQLLDDKNENIQHAGALGLYALGQKAKPAIPKLLAMLAKTNSNNPDDIFVLEFAIKGIDPDAAAKAGIK
ncbi:MAG TPA: HEAT repeat domain-containing protein [Verrucomicrobiae bacterium]|nr:HEAT repeat domain-containing protein [Verrucomicrobiae bacterium]